MRVRLIVMLWAALSASVAEAETLGFVLSNFDYLLYGSGRTACPDGFVHTNRENWEAQFPTRAARQAHLNRCGGFPNRGPNCENVWTNPEVIADPLPFREVKGRVAYGVNLGAGSCPHEEFTSPGGESGIDNQYYRFIGCEKLLRNDSLPEQTVRKIIAERPVLRLLLEINGVDDEKNDDAVEVLMLRGKDPLIVDAAGKAVPWQSQRVDEYVPRELIYRLRGRLVNGSLTTEPADVMWYDILSEQSLLIRGMSLRLSLTPQGAEGLRVGYIDVDQLWQSYSKYAPSEGVLFGASAPAAYAAMRRLADGYKDERTGACTALSSARKLEFVRAYVVHVTGAPK